jgi:hypothetical protein
VCFVCVCSLCESNNGQTIDIFWFVSDRVFKPPRRLRIGPGSRQYMVARPFIGHSSAVHRPFIGHSSAIHRPLARSEIGRILVRLRISAHSDARPDARPVIGAHSRNGAHSGSGYFAA